MGASCTTIKIGKVIKPIRSHGELPTQPDSLNAVDKKIYNHKRKSSRSRKNSGETSLHVAGTQHFGSKNQLPSTHEGLEETPRPPSSHFLTTDIHHNMSEISDDTIYRKSAHYKKGPLIGKGSSGEVYECLNLNTGELVAVKEIRLYGDLDKMQSYTEALKKENALFRTLNHPNIMRYYETEINEVPDQNYLQIDIAVEYVSGGSIKALLDKFHMLEEKVVMSYTRQILEGLAYLHSTGIVHRNLKGTNILIDASGTIKLSDFGSFKFDRFSEENPQETNRTSVGMKNALYWLAPEVVMKKAMGKPADIWSVGCVAIEMLTGTAPWKNLSTNPEETLKLITSGTPPPFPSDISESCRDFLYKTFKFKPEDRPTAADLLEHPFVRDVSPNNSFFEADTLHSSLFGKPTEFLRNNSNNERNSNAKNNDARLQNLGTNLSLNVSRIVSRSYTNDYVINNGIVRSPSNEIMGIPMSTSDVQETEQNGLLKSQIKKSGLNKVQEASWEDEYTPSPASKQFFPTKINQSWEKKASGLEDSDKMEEQDIEKIKAEKRRQIEEEMMREMNQTSRDHIREDWDHEDDTHQEIDRKEYSAENIQLEEADDNKMAEEVKVRPRVAPIQNPLFKRLATVEFQEEEDDDNEDEDDRKANNASPLQTGNNFDDEIQKRFAEIRPTTSEGMWAIEEGNEKEAHEINSGAMKTPSEKDTENQVSVIGHHLDETWTEDLEGPSAYPGNRNRLIRSDLERLRRSKQKQVEQEMNCEVVDITAPYKLNLLEVAGDDSSINHKESPSSYNGDPRLVETFPPKTYRSEGPVTPKEIINIGGTKEVFIQRKRDNVGYTINIIS